MCFLGPSLQKYAESKQNHEIMKFMPTLFGEAPLSESRKGSADGFVGSEWGRASRDPPREFSREAPDAPVFVCFLKRSFQIPDLVRS